MFILAPVFITLGVMNLLSNREPTDSIMAAAIRNGTASTGGAENASVATVSAQQAIDEAIQNLAGYEIVFSYDDTYDFIHTFADFVGYMDEDMTAVFDVDKINDALAYINNQISLGNIDKEAALYDVMAILSGELDSNTVVLVSEWIRSENLANKDLLGTFYTYFNPGETGRNGNIARAAELVNNFTLLPGQVFSMNETIAPVNLDNGYHIALVIANGEFVEGIGGGVCQVSSTLYMAVLHAELEIVQRRAHSRMVGYVPPAFDSVLATPYLDLRFRNNTSAAITIETRFDIRSHRITVSIWGQETRPPGRTISFESIQRAANDSYVTYHLYKIENNNGALSRSRVNISTYRAEQEGVITYYQAVGGTLDD